MAQYSLEGIYQNVRGLRSRTNEMYQFSCQSAYDFIAVTETWLYDDIYSGEIFGHGYDVHRKDRNSVATGKCRGRSPARAH